MGGYDPPEYATVSIRVEDGTAVQAHRAGLTVRGSENHRIVDLTLDLDHTLVQAAATHCRAEEYEESPIIEYDLARQAHRLYDHTPLGSGPVLRDGRPVVWDEPSVGKIIMRPLPPVPGHADAAAIARAATFWVDGHPGVDPERFGEAQVRWEAQVRFAVVTMGERADAVRPGANANETTELDDALDTLEAAVADGPGPEDMTDDGEGPRQMTHGEVIDDAIRRLQAVIDQIGRATAARERRQEIVFMANLLARERYAELPERIQLAVDADLVEECLGATRAALTELCMPGWATLPDPDVVKAPSNPPLEVLETYAEMKRQWPELRLGFVPGSERGKGSYVVITDFLGRTVFDSIAA